MNNQEKEEWRPVVGYENYMVSNTGKIRSVGHWRKGKANSRAWHKGKILKPHISNRGYLRVGVQCKDSKTHMVSVHRLVAEAFIPNPNELPEINHLDEDKTNNNVSNLEWSTSSHNINWGTRNERVASKMERPIIMIRLSDKKETYFKSITEAERQGYSPRNDLYHKNKRRLRHDGYCWKYADDKNFVVPQYKSWKKAIMGKSIINNSIIRFESIHDANRQGYTRTSIKRAIHNGNAYRNYLWSFI